MHDDAGFELSSLDESTVADVMELYRLGMQPLWDRYGRDYDLARVEANMRERINQRDYWMTVVRRGAEVVGYWAWDKELDHTAPHVAAHLRMILVRPGLQGTGLGKMMMERFEAAAKIEGCTKILFDVIVGSPAYDFYCSQGYRHWSNYMEKPLVEKG